MNYKTIGNTLTPSEFNAIQYLLNKNMSRTITITLNETEILTEYGTLKLTFGTKHYKRKNGFNTNSLKLKLINPLIENMDYTIQLRYKTINDDLLDHDDDTTTTVTYNLPANTEITITEATLDHIITNNAELTITFDKPVMQKTRTLTLNNHEFWTANTETIDITATILENTTPVPDVEVEFTTGSTTITETTGSDGVATYTYTGVKAGNLNYTVSAGGLTEHFRIYDAKFHNQVFYNHYNRITVNNKTLTNTSGSDGYYLIDESGSATTLTQCYQYDPPFAILMRITGYTEGSRFFMYDGSHSFRPEFSTLSPEKQEFVLRVEVSTDKVEYYVDGELREDLTWEDGTVGRIRAGFALLNGASVTYEDVYLTDITPEIEPATITVSSDKDVLSYSDEDTCTLTATVLDDNDEAIEGVTVEFWNGSTSMGTATTNSSGIATKTYASAGVGDVTFTASVGSLSSETYAIEDIYKYYDSVPKSDSTVNLTLPTHFELTFKLYSRAATTDPSYAFMRFNSSSGPYMGKGSSGNGKVGINSTTLNTISSNVEYSYQLVYDGTTKMYIKDTSTSITVNTGALTNLYMFTSSTNTDLTDIKIKPL